METSLFRRTSAYREHQFKINAIRKSIIVCSFYARNVDTEFMNKMDTYLINKSGIKHTHINILLAARVLPSSL